MEYDYSSSRQRAGASSYDPHIPMYQKFSSSTSSQPPYASSSLYPKIGQSGQPVVPPPARAPPNHHSSTPPSSSGTGIRVQIKPQYGITPPPQLSPQMGDIPRSTFQFDFGLEKKILAEAEKENPNWSRFASENLPSRTTQSMPSTTPAVDPVVNKYIASGLNREAVPLAVAAFGDNPTKIQEFVNGFTLLREMGFSSNNVADVLLMHDNDTEKALAHFLGSSFSQQSGARCRSRSSVPTVLCYHNEVAPLRTVKFNGPIQGRRFFGCSHWPRTCGYFKWADVHDEVTELQFALFEKDTQIAELEMEKEELQRQVKKLKEKRDDLEEQCTELAIQITETRLGIEAVKADRKLAFGLIVSWIFFAMVFLLY